MKNAVGNGEISTVRVLQFALALVGCGGGGDARNKTSTLTPQEEIARLEASGDLPTLERGASLGGIDDNHNGGAVNCRGAVFPGIEGFKDAYRMSQEMEALTTNTLQRLKAYMAYNKAVSGTVSQLPTGDTCD
ncbi:MAG: hypothetical protein AB7S86_10475 [Hydrogenophaga sp.]|uniref:hypothetical protein n=1 Tax=Hydrogenophaga sp. TaxID=1904254 RepID=UPI003D0D7EC0